MLTESEARAIVAVAAVGAEEVPPRDLRMAFALLLLRLEEKIDGAIAHFARRD